MSFGGTKQELLFAFFSRHNGIVTSNQLKAAVANWKKTANQSLESVLRSECDLDAAEYQLLKSLLRVHLEKNGCDPQEALTALLETNRAVRDEFEQLGWFDETNAVETDAVETLAPAETLPPSENNPATITLPPVEPEAEPKSATMAHDWQNDPPSGGVAEAGAAGTEVDRFHILRPHARGGLGEVFVGMDGQLNREVALKEIQSRHAQNPDSRNRFVLEAEVTGGLEHPGIVPVYGLGQHPDGRPYYAMRFIRGQSLQEAIVAFHKGASADDFSGLDGTVASGPTPAEESPKADPGKESSGDSLPQLAAARFRSLEIRTLLGQFVDVCNAIHYAHARGVLHRDLKPANIMLGKYGETLVVDWGLAKLAGEEELPRSPDSPGESVLSASSVSGTTPTQFGSAMGTPAYMPPEQATGTLDELGPASDVYSLGATLYHLLAGRPPIANLKLSEMLTRVKAGDFPSPKKVQRNIPRPLESICLKAMALDPQQRYESPRALADDVESFLADEPVSAHKEPAGVRVRRWLRKHPRTLAFLSASILIGLTSTVVVSGVVATKNQQLETANEQLQRSNLRERTAKAEAEAKRVEAELAQAKAEAAAEAERAAKEAEKAVADYVVKILRSPNPKFDGPDVTMAELLDRTVKDLENEFGNAPDTKVSLLTAIAGSYLGLGLYEKGAALLEQGVQIRLAAGADNLETTHAMNRLAEAYRQGWRLTDAEALFSKAIQRYEKELGADDLHTLNARRALAVTYAVGNQADKAIRILEELLPQFRARLGEQNPNTRAVMSGLAVAYQGNRNFKKALPLLEQELRDDQKKLGEDDPATLSTMHNLAAAYVSSGDIPRAITLFERTIALQEKRLSPDHPQRLLSMKLLADSYKLAGRIDKAMPLLDETLKRIRAKLGNTNLQTLATMLDMGSVYQDAGQLGRAIPLYEEAVAGYLSKYDPKDKEYSTTLTAMRYLAKAYHAANQMPKAVQWYEKLLPGHRIRALCWPCTTWLRSSRSYSSSTRRLLCLKGGWESYEAHQGNFRRKRWGRWRCCRRCM